MKISFYVFLLSLMMGATANAQLHISPGIIGGMNFSGLSGQDVNYSTTITRFGAGVFAELDFPLLPFSIEPEVLYGEKGGKGPWNGGLEEMSSVVTFNYSYIEIPLLIKYYFPALVIQPFIMIGPSFGFLISAKEEQYSIAGNGEYTLDVKDQTASSDIGAVVGIGVKVPFMVFDLSLDARYNFGFTNIRAGDSRNINNRTVSVFLGVAF